MHYTLAYLSYNGLNTSFLCKNNNKKTHTTYSQNAQHTCTTPIFSVSKRSAHMSCVSQCTKLTYSVSQCIPIGSPSHGGDVTVYIWHRPAKLANSFLFCPCVYFGLYGTFNCIAFHKFSWQLSIFSFCSCGLISALLVLSTVYLFLKVSFRPDILVS